jgi:hypothetical protein
MRKLEQKMVEALNNSENFNGNNTTVIFDKSTNQSSIFLHGHLIAEYNHTRCAVYANGETLARYPTNTTKSRLRALGVNVYTKKGVTYLNDIAV